MKSREIGEREVKSDSRVRVKPGIPISSAIDAATCNLAHERGPIIHVKQCDGGYHSRTTLSSSVNVIFAKVKHFMFYCYVVPTLLYFQGKYYA